MSIYRALGNQVASAEALSLGERLTAWHDALVMHERRLLGIPGVSCGEECPHVEARPLWHAALAVFGDRAHELRLLAKHGARGERPAVERRRIA